MTGRKDESEVALRGTLPGACRGERAAWEGFEASSRPSIEGAVHAVFTRHGRGSDRDGVLDVVQEVFVRLVRDDRRLLRRYDPARSTLSTYLAVIARSTANNALRARFPETGLTPEEAEAAAAPEPEGRGTPAIPLELLSTRQRLVMAMSFDEELEVPEIAAILEISEQTVRSTRHKALERLRAHFAAEAVSGKPAARGDVGAARRVPGVEETR